MPGVVTADFVGAPCLPASRRRLLFHPMPSLTGCRLWACALAGGFPSALLCLSRSACPQLSNRWVSASGQACHLPVVCRLSSVCRPLSDDARLRLLAIRQPTPRDGTHFVVEFGQQLSFEVVVESRNLGCAPVISFSCQGTPHCPSSLCAAWRVRHVGQGLGTSWPPPARRSFPWLQIFDERDGGRLAQHASSRAASASWRTPTTWLMTWHLALWRFAARVLLTEIRCALTSWKRAEEAPASSSPQKMFTSLPTHQRWCRTSLAPMKSASTPPRGLSFFPLVFDPTSRPRARCSPAAPAHVLVAPLVFLLTRALPHVSVVAERRASLDRR